MDRGLKALLTSAGILSPEVSILILMDRGLKEHQENHENAQKMSGFNPYSNGQRT